MWERVLFEHVYMQINGARCLLKKIYAAIVV